MICLLGKTMRKYCILVSGPLVSNDKELIRALGKTAVVLTNSDNKKIKSIFTASNVDLTILELSKGESNEVEIIKCIKTRFQDVIIILINGDRELFVKAFNLGVKDAFRKPYRWPMLVERVNALLG